MCDTRPCRHAYGDDDTRELPLKFSGFCKCMAHLFVKNRYDISGNMQLAQFPVMVSCHLDLIVKYLKNKFCRGEVEDGIDISVAIKLWRGVISHVDDGVTALNYLMKTTAIAEETGDHVAHAYWQCQPGVITIDLQYCAVFEFQLWRRIDDGNQSCVRPANGIQHSLFLVPSEAITASALDALQPDDAGQRLPVIRPRNVRPVTGSLGVQFQ